MSKSLLDRVSIGNSCQTEWEAMHGDARQRYCNQCEKHVYNLSQMSRREAETLLRRTNGKLCARFKRRADGSIITKEKSFSLPRLNQKFLRLASATISAALSLSPTVTAKPAKNLPVLNLGQEKKEKSEPQEKEKTAKIYGIVVDASGAVIPNVKIILTNETTGNAHNAVTSMDGAYEIAFLEADKYNLRFAANGFIKLTQKNIEISGGQSLQRNARLVVQAEDVFTGVVDITPEHPILLPEQAAENMSLRLHEKNNKGRQKSWVKILLSPFRKITPSSRNK